ncbi:DUF2169 domain-containing protein [Paraburkholderia sp. J67]|uniref:DUF2169 family type VI secretion system accessory protein n=1 Tax=Paraburkholderia sp. J67 TaxID=2805435 RepID=UPI002ABE2B39|nr:DUF2169 domain-containing protein [Paraburkholderia sp. J67]
MWSIENHTPFAADRTWLRDTNGAEVWVVAIKATYDILANGTTKLASDQVSLNAGPVQHEGLSSLKYDTDFGPSKAATDVILNGHAWTPGGKPAGEILAGFTVANLDRMVRVTGDRYWQRKRWSWHAGEPEPFVSMPIVYERAFGVDMPEFPTASRNPVGRGVASDAEGRVWLPNIELVGQPVRGRDDVAPAISLGAIAGHWPMRRQFAGTYDDNWLEERHPLPPEDLNPRFWQIAPEAQQVTGHLKGGEIVTLINVTPPDVVPGGRLVFRLPKVTLVCETFFFDGSREQTRPVIHTVILEPDEPRISVVHHMTLACHAKVNQLDRTRITMKRRPLDRPDAPVFDAREAPLSNARSV